jgi:hypothetical protein
MAQKDPGENGAPAANSQDEEDLSCCTCEAQGQHKGRPQLHSSYKVLAMDVLEGKCFSSSSLVHGHFMING